MTARKFSQTLTHWVSSAVDFKGQKTFAAPVTLLGRWEDRSIAFNFRNTQGNDAGEELMSDAIVYLNTPVALQDFIYLGLSAEGNPATVVGAFWVKRVDKSTSLRGNNALYRVML
tara:strand:- start:4250 stop:4594 length:345 start_codon:yes stop_codon:yes gene_type:complete